MRGSGRKRGFRAQGRALNGEPQELLVYSRRHCGLCEQMEAAILEAWPEVRVRRVEIDDEPELMRRFGRDVPVLSLDGEVICKHVLDPVRLRAALQAP